MSFLALRDTLPDYANDLKSSVDRLNAETVLSDQQKWGCYLTCAFALGVPEVIQAATFDAETRLSIAARKSAKAAAAISGMNAVYFSAVNALRNTEYRIASPHFSQAALTHEGVEKIDVELWSLAASALANSAPSLNAHEAELHKRGVSIEMIQAAIRIAAIVSAISIVVRGEVATIGV